MAYSKVKEAVTEVEVKVIEPAEVTLVLTDTEAKQLLALLGQATAVPYAPENQPIMSVFHALDRAVEKMDPDYRSWNAYRVVNHDGKSLPPYIVKPKDA